MLLWSDEMARKRAGKPPKFPLAEREYFLRSLRPVKQVIPVNVLLRPGELPAAPGFQPAILGGGRFPRRGATKGILRQDTVWNAASSPKSSLADFPPSVRPPHPHDGARKKVVVTGTYDWLHSGMSAFSKKPARSATSTWSWATTPTSVCSRAKATRFSRNRSGSTWCKPSAS